MSPLPASLLRRTGQFARYGAVSLVATAVGQSVLAVLVATATLAPGWANVVATSVGTVPSFELNRRWVWGRDGRSSLRREVVPFCALSFAGLALSTVAVALTGRWAAASGLDTTTRTVAVQVANLAAFGALWVVQFVMLDHFLFGRRRAAPAVVLAAPAVACEPSPRALADAEAA